MVSEDIAPLVSIITPCYNAEKFIGEFLDSVLAQTYSPLELILINDGSTDNTLGVITNYKSKLEKQGIKLILISQKNSGQASAINQGLKIFSGLYFTWPDADDVMTPDNIQLKIEYALIHPNHQLIRGKRKKFKDNLNLAINSDDNRNFFNEDIFFDLFTEKTFPSGGCYLMKADLFFVCYPKKTIFAGLGSQNWQLLVPAASRTKCGNIDEFIYYYREYPNSFSRRPRTIEEMFARFDDHKEILLDSFKHSICDFEYCKSMILGKYCRRKYQYALKIGNSEMGKKYYENLRKMDKITLKDVFFFNIMKNHGLYVFFDKTKKFLLSTAKLLKKLKKNNRKITRSTNDEM